MTAGNSGVATVPEICLKSCGLDCVVLGEGEVTSAELANAVEEGRDWKQVPGMAWMNYDGLLTKSSPGHLLPILIRYPAN